MQAKASQLFQTRHAGGSIEGLAIPKHSQSWLFSCYFLSQTESLRNFGRSASWGCVIWPCKMSCNFPCLDLGSMLWCPFSSGKNSKMFGAWCVCCFDTWGYGTKSTDFVEKKWRDFMKCPHLFCRRGCRVWICQARTQKLASCHLSFIFDAPIPILIKSRKEHVPGLSKGCQMVPNGCQFTIP